MLLAVSVLTFTLLSSAGGDVLSGLRDNPQISEATIQDLEKVYDLDQPLAWRYGAWLSGVVRGDLGDSFSFHIPVSSLIWSRFGNTALMALFALSISIFSAFILAVLAIRFPNRKLRAAIEAIVLISASTPRMVLALVAFATILRWTTRVSSGGGMDLTVFICGAAILSIPVLSLLLAQLTTGLTAAMNEDFVMYARAKGLSEWVVIFRHALRAALNPFLTTVGLSLGGLLSGSVVVESILGWQGIGALMINGVRSRDVPLVMGIVVFASLSVWIGNTLAEFLQALNDDRVRSGGGS